MKPIDLTPFGPKREVITISANEFIVRVTPPALVGGAPQDTHLDAEQLCRYFKWRDRKMLMQDALPELTPDQRECLMTGLAPDVQRRIFTETDQAE